MNHVSSPIKNMEYLQIQNTTQLPIVGVNLYIPRFNYVECNSDTINIRNYDGELGIFEKQDDNLRKIPYYDMRETAFNEYDITLMRQNNNSIMGEMANEVQIKIQTPDYCHNLQFNKKIKASMFHFSDKCMESNIYYTKCENLGGVSSADKRRSLIIGLTVGLTLGLPCLYCIIIIIISAIIAYYSDDDKN